MLNENFKQLKPNQAELALLSAMRQKEIAVKTLSDAESVVNSLNDLTSGLWETVPKDDADLIRLIRSHDLNFNDQTLEALSYLESLDPVQVSYFLTFYVCQLAFEVEDQDPNFFSNDGVQSILRLQQFLLQWSKCEVVD